MGASTSASDVPKSAAQVIGPTMPSTLSGRPSASVNRIWKRLTAIVVGSLKRPLSATGPQPAALRRRWMASTTSGFPAPALTERPGKASGNVSTVGMKPPPGTGPRTLPLNQDHLQLGFLARLHRVRRRARQPSLELLQGDGVRRGRLPDFDVEDGGGVDAFEPGILPEVLDAEHRGFEL